MSGVKGSFVARVAVVPAYDAERTIAALVRELREGFEEVWVIDDGSADETAALARSSGARVLSHASNRGKGAALRTALSVAARRGLSTIVTVDADGQHLPEDAFRLAAMPDPEALLLGVRDLEKDGAPRQNRRGNRIASYWIRQMTHRVLADSQCGLRRYPVSAANALGARADRFGFESEILVRALAAGVPVIEVPVRVRYPEERTSHFHVWRDPLLMTASLMDAGRRLGTFVQTFATMDLAEAYAIHFGPAPESKATSEVPGAARSTISAETSTSRPLAVEIDGAAPG